MPSTASAADGAGDRTLFAAALGFIGMAMFAGTLPATRLAVVAFEPAFITAGRAVLAGVLAAAVLLATRNPMPPRSDWPSIAILSLCLLIGFPLFTGLAMLYVPANHGAVVLAILPLATACAAALVGGERPGPVFWLLSIVGGALVLAFSLSESGWILVAGDALLLAAAASAALGYALSGRLSRRMPGWAVVSWALVFSLPFSIAATVLLAPPVLPNDLAAWAGFAYLGVFSIFLGFFFWNAAMGIGGIAKIGQLQLLQPFLTMMFATLVAEEALEARLFGDATVVVLIVAAAQRLKVRGPATLARLTAGAPPSTP